jgi:hypothetical protein
LIENDPHSGEPMAAHLSNIALIESFSGSHNEAMLTADRACEEAKNMHDPEAMARSLYAYGTYLW